MNTITWVGGDLWIDNNDLLQDLSPLENILSIGQNSIQGGSLHVLNNDSLKTLTGLENIAASSMMNLNIYNNLQLSACDVSSICYYLSDPAGSVDIHDNKLGCNNQEEILLACIDSEEEISDNNESFIIFPNPCSGAAQIRITNNKQQITKLEVFGISGMKIKELMNEEMLPGTYDVEVDLRDLPAGVYYLVLTTNDGIHSEKLIKL